MMAWNHGACRNGSLQSVRLVSLQEKAFLEPCPFLKYVCVLDKYLVQVCNQVAKQEQELPPCHAIYHDLHDCMTKSLLKAYKLSIYALLFYPNRIEVCNLSYK